MSIQRSLIGMSLADVHKAFGIGKVVQDGKLIEYNITEDCEPYKTGSLAAIALSIKLINGKVDSYTVAAVRWG